MALDLSSPLKVVSWASINADCPMRYTTTGSDEVVIIFGRASDEFELALEADALRTLAQLATDAVTAMSAVAEDTLSPKP
jgi:hypothetical protein